MKRTLANLTLSVCSVSLFVGLAELPAAVGLIDYGALLRSRLETGQGWRNPRNRIDDELLWIHRPNQHIQGEVPGDMVAWLEIASDRRYTVDLSYDHNGFRNAHQRDSADIVLLGDSFLEWSIVAQEDLLGDVLERRTGLWVTNLSQAGHGPQQERIILDRYGLPLHPSLVVWAFFEGNDLLDVHRYRGWVSEWDSVRTQMQGFRDRSLLATVRAAANQILAQPPSTDGPEAIKRSCHIVDGWADAGTTLYFAYDGKPLDERDVEALAITEDLILDARDAVRASGSELVLVFLPIKFRVYGDACQFPDGAYGLDWSLSDLPQRMAAWSGEVGIPFLDLTPSLQRAAREHGLVYFTDDGHWSALGHAAAADTLATFLGQSGLIPDAGR